MSNRETLNELFPAGEIIEQEEHPGTLFKIQKDRDPFGDEILLIRFLGPEPEYEYYRDTDIQQLEQIFYDDETPNPWNIQLFWVYESGELPPKSIRRELEGDTRFAIRRVVPRDLLVDFVAPLEKANEKLENISNQFNRGELIQDIFDQGLGFLFNDDPRSDKLDRLKNGQFDEQSITYDDSFERDPIQEFVQTINLGDFREDEVILSKLNLQPFTLLHGPNASGKTSLLDAVALGLIGHIRRPEDRVSEYSGLSVTLEGHTNSLDTDSEALNNRVANWYGYRPHGPQSKYDEFYRVNYLEAGRATRLVDPDPDLDIQQTLKRFLYGEELIDAINDKRELVEDLQKAIDTNREKIEDQESEIRQLEQTRERVEDIFSELRAAARSLSPAGVRLVTEEPGGTKDEPQPAQLETWSEWAQRFDLLEASLEALPQEDPPQRTPQEIYQQLEEAVQQQTEVITIIEEYQDYQAKLRRLEELTEYWKGDERRSTPAPVALIALILAHHGLDADDLTALRESILRAMEPAELREDRRSVITWQQTVRTSLKSHLKDIEERKEQIEELSDLESRQEELRTEIRSKTEEYLSIVQKVNHCPACYVEQDRQEILNREEPSEQSIDDYKGNLTELKQRISSTEQALKAVESVDWKEVDHAISGRFYNACNIGDFHEFWRVHFDEEDSLRFPSVVSSDTVEVFAEGVEHTSESTVGTPSTETVLYEAEAMLSAERENLSSDIPPLEESLADTQAVREQYEQKKSTLETGLRILDEYWPKKAWDHDIDVAGDRRVMQTTLNKFEEEPATLELSTNIERDIRDAEQDIDHLREQNDQYLESIDRLNSAFELTDSGAQLDSLVEDHMTVISTLFIAFQRPYEFKSVDLQDKEIVIQRRDTGELVGPDALSSGQRAALSLAIFVTNNLAHETAPPLMLLDEPFAHLDDVNTVSFFNLLIELATRRDRQIIFATANRDIADLIERKAGDAEQFKPENLPRVKAGFEPE
jgi:exonuclease SbcC